MKEQNGGLRLVWTCAPPAATRVTEMKTFQPLHLRDVIISSIYNTQGKANTVRDRRRQSLTDRVGTVISVIYSRLCLQIKASRCSCLAPGECVWLHKRHDWKKLHWSTEQHRRAAAALCKAPRLWTPKDKHNNTQRNGFLNKEAKKRCRQTGKNKTKQKILRVPQSQHSKEPTAHKLTAVPAHIVLLTYICKKKKKTHYFQISFAYKEVKCKLFNTTIRQFVLSIME